jgi:putative endonuclease
MGVVSAQYAAGTSPRVIVVRVTDPRHALGLAAEEATARWLAGAGWTIVGRRMRAGGGGEVDIVGVDPSRTLVAIEVRARSSVRAGAPSASVDARRVGRLARTLVAVAAGARIRHTGLRVDLVTAEPEPGSAGRWRLRRLAGIG